MNAQPTNPSAGSTTVKEVYGELLVPVVKDLPFVKELNVDLAYRYSDYNSIGGVSTYKGSIDWKANEWLRLRGGYQRAIRAPNIGELFTAPTPNSESLGTIGPIGSHDPCDVRTAYRSASYAGSAQVRALCLAQGVPASIIDNYRNTNSRTATASQGNPNLTEETADTFSYGAVVRPDFASPLFKTISFSADYYDIKLQDAIGTVTGLLTLSKCFNADGSNPTYSPTNYFCTQVSRESATGLISVINTRLTYALGDVSAAVQWRYTDSMHNANNVGTTGTARGVAQRNYIDLDGSWRIRPDLELAGGVVNLTDRPPPLLGTTLGTTSLSTYDLLGRRYYLRLTARF